MSESSDLIFFTRSGDATRIEIDCTQCAAQPVNRLLFGKFTEHLGRNIYNGMWAQILQNSSFADWSYYRPMWRQAGGRWGQGDVIQLWETPP